MIKNLAQLKRALVKGAEYVVVEHCRAEHIGEHRRVNYADTTGFYSGLPSDPNGKMSTANGGRGSFLGWSKAPFWSFSDDGVCAIYSLDKSKAYRTPIIAFILLDGGEPHEF